MSAVREIDVLVTIVVDWVFVDDPVDSVFIEGEMMVSTVSNAPLDGILVLIGT